MFKKDPRTLIIALVTIVSMLIFVGGGYWWYQSRSDSKHSKEEDQAPSVNQPSPLPAIENIENVENVEKIENAITSPLTRPPLSSPSASVVAISAPLPTSHTTPSAISSTFDGPVPAKKAPSRIMAATIDLDSSVIEVGWEVKNDQNGNPYSEWIIPDLAAGWHKNSALPGHGGNVVFSGHHNIGSEVFRDLIKLESGDEISVEAGNLTYAYIVEQKLIVKEEGQPIEVRRENNRFIEAKADERLTLVTCWPYESNSHRVIVIARPVWELPK
ncbi:MAG: sortase [Ardenticatenaceae bacterium]